MPTTRKDAPRVGDRLWRVEWCDRLAFDDAGDIDRDRCRIRQRTFTSRDEARDFAVLMWPETHDKLGLVEVDEIEFTAYDEEDAIRYPHIGYWECVNECGEVFSGEWE